MVEQTQKVIHVIYGGGSIGENMSYSWKVMVSTSALKETGKRQHYKKDTYFFDEDLANVMRPHEDSLVITTSISPNATVEKVIIGN